MLLRLLLAVLMLSACAKRENDFGIQPPEPVRQAEIPPAERPLVIPNNLFDAVYNNSLADVKRLIKEQPGSLEATNKDGDRPLGFAIKLGYREVTQALIDATTAQQLTHVNKAGESYVMLAARSGFHEAITALGDRYYSSVSLPAPSLFVTLDPPTADGKRALHFAATRLAVEAIEIQYQKDLWGAVKLFFWDFMLPTDSEGRNFLHLAASEGRADVINWAAMRVCAKTGLEASDQWYLQWAGTFFTFLWQGIETYTPEEVILNTPSPQIFNRQDRTGRTPLHHAVANRQWKALGAIQSCRWTDYEFQDHEGDLALHLFLKGLDPKVLVYDEETRVAFESFLFQTTTMRQPFVNTPGRINHVNKAGDSAMHLAAKLADPFFYATLRRMGGDEWKHDAQGVMAGDRFDARRKQIEEYGE